MKRNNIHHYRNAGFDSLVDEIYEELMKFPKEE